MAISGLQLLQQLRNAVTRAIDAVSLALIGISLEHSRVHQGVMFHAHHESNPASLPTNAGEETAIGFRTPAAAISRIHMIIDVRADEESVWELREDPTVVLNQGTRSQPRNRFRDSSISSLLNDLETNTPNGVSTFDVGEANLADLSGGAILEHETLAIAGGPPFAGVANSEARGQREWILKAETEYVIIITSSTIADTVHEISLTWYETVHKNE